MRKEDILKLKISELGFSERIVSSIIRDASYYIRKIEGCNLYDKESKRNIKKWAKIISVAEIISLRDEVIASEDKRWIMEFRDKAISFGLTKLDWLALPYETARKEFGDYSREDLKRKSVLLLEPPAKILRSICSYAENNRMFWAAECEEEECELGTDDSRRYELLGKNIPIRALLGMSRNKFGKRHNFSDSIFNLCQKLLEMGFEYEDGIFLQEGTRREFVEKLMKEEGLSKIQAQKFADLAHKLGYVGNSRKWDLIR